MPKALLDFLGYKFFFWSNEMQNRHMCMCAGESKLQMQQNFGLQQMELNLIIIKVRFRRMI